MKKAQGGKDEREQQLTIEAHKFAGTISILVTALLALAVVLDGYLLESARMYSFEAVAFLLIGIGGLNNFLFSVHQMITLKKKDRIPSVIVFGGLVVWAIIMVTKTLLV